MSTPKESHEEKDKKTSLREKAINKGETEGKKINHQVEQRREQHEPRDNT